MSFWYIKWMVVPAKKRKSIQICQPYNNYSFILCNFTNMPSMFYSKHCLNFWMGPGQFRVRQEDTQANGVGPAPSSEWHLRNILATNWANQLSPTLFLLFLWFMMTLWNLELRYIYPFLVFSGKRSLMKWFKFILTWLAVTLSTCVVS